LVLNFTNNSGSKYSGSHQKIEPLLRVNGNGMFEVDHKHDIVDAFAVNEYAKKKFQNLVSRVFCIN
jgi:hypothetical protein